MAEQNINMIQTLKSEISRLFFISFGVFLFILFFQPFPLEMLEYNDRLLYVTGFGGLTFFNSCVVLILIPLSLPKYFKISEWESGPTLVLNLFFLILTTTSFAFYIRFVGKVDLTIYIIFKIILVCLIPLIILIILYRNKSLEKRCHYLLEHNKVLTLKLVNSEKNLENEYIEIDSSNKSDILKIKYRNIVLIKSADNYIELYYIKDDQIVKQLFRTTLKNIESQLAPQNIFIRCHRTSIVNSEFIEKLIRNYQGYHLKISFIENPIPVARPYLKQIQEVINSNDFTP